MTPGADAVVTTQVGYGLEVRSQATGEPHQFNIALAFALKAPARKGAARAANEKMDASAKVQTSIRFMWHPPQDLLQRLR